MTVKEFSDRLRYAIEHPKCKRCGKELYIPKPPKEKQQEWGIFAWTAFVKQYAKHHGWYELENLNKNIVCPECLQETDTPNNIILDCYDRWISEYNKWRKEYEKDL